MINTKQRTIVILAIGMSMIMSGCGSGQLFGPTITPTATHTPTITPTPIGGGSGAIIYTDGWTLYSINTNGNNKILIDDPYPCGWHISFSPDGHYLTCSVVKQKNDNSHGGYGVILIDLETYTVVNRFAESIEIFSSYGNDESAGWSHDSNWIAFGGLNNGKAEIYIVNIQDSTIKQIPSDDTQLSNPKWSPDGKKISFVKLNHVAAVGIYPEGVSLNGVYVVNSDGTNLIKLSDGGQDVTWGTDSSTLFVDEQGFNLETMQPNGETVTVQQLNSFMSPNGKYQIIFEGNPIKIYLQSLEDSQKTDITEKYPVDTQNFINILNRPPQWSPDSKTLAYYDETKSSIFLLPIDTLTVSHLVDVKRDPQNHYDYYNGDFLWLPDGKHIIFVQADGNGGFEVNLTDLSGNLTALFTTKNPVGIHIEPTRH